jgi:regulation of enolase protein 1 (concanavalin A-like superfamily)
MRWLDEPPAWSEDDGTVRMTTAPGTDFWRTTHYAARLLDPGAMRAQTPACRDA